MTEFEQQFPKMDDALITSNNKRENIRKGWFAACEWFLSLEEELGIYGYAKVEEERNELKELST